MKVVVLRLAFAALSLNALAESYTYEDTLRQRAAQLRNPHLFGSSNSGGYGATAPRYNGSAPAYRYPSSQSSPGYSYGGYPYRSQNGGPRR